MARRAGARTLTAIGRLRGRQGRIRTCEARRHRFYRPRPLSAWIPAVECFIHCTILWSSNKAQIVPGDGRARPYHGRPI